jgi:hypothetical protein
MIGEYCGKPTASGSPLAATIPASTIVRGSLGEGSETVEHRTKTSRNDSVVDVSKVHGRYRRPTGAPPPLPKKIGATGVLRLALVVVVVIPGCIWLHYNPAPLDRFDAAITDAVVSLRTGWLDTLARSVNTVASRYGLALLGLITVASVAWFRRWRHLTLFLIGVAVVGVSMEGLLLIAARPRPFDVTITVISQTLVAARWPQRRSTETVGSRRRSAEPPVYAAGPMRGHRPSRCPNMACDLRSPNGI